MEEGISILTLAGIVEEGTSPAWLAGTVEEGTSILIRGNQHPDWLAGIVEEGTRILADLLVLWKREYIFWLVRWYCRRG